MAVSLAARQIQSALTLVIAMSLVSPIIGCNGHSQAVSGGIDRKIEEIQQLKDPKALADARQQIYALGPSVLPSLKTSIASIYDHNQTQLIAAASAFPDSEALLSTFLRTRDPLRRRQILNGISLMSRPPEAGGVLPLTYSRIASDREWALYALDENNDLDARSAFLRLTKDPDPNVRMQAARGLRHFPGPDSVAALEQLMDEKESGITMEATVSLGRIDPANPKVKQRLESLSPILRNGSPNQKEELAQIFGESQTPTGEAMLAQMLADPDPRVRLLAAAAYARLRHVHNAGPLLRSMNTDPDPHVRAQAAHTLGVQHVSAALPDFRKMVFSKNRDAARAAAAALKDMDDPMSAGILMAMLKVPDYEIRRLSAVAQMQMSLGRPDYFPIVDQILDDSTSESPDVRKTAASYLKDLPGPQAAGKLEALESDPDPSVRLAAMEARKKQIGMCRILPDILDHPRPSWDEPLR